jgi:putative ABC transport system permease protein
MRVIDEPRQSRVFAMLDGLRQDATYALRGLRKSPGFSAVAILSLALGIGANTTIFTFVNAVLLRPLAYPDPDRLVVLREKPRDSSTTVAVHPQNFLEWQARSRSFAALALVQTPPLNVIGEQGAEQISRAQVTPDLFGVFALPMTLGRGFTEAETRPGGAGVVVLGYHFWQRWFGGDPAVLGRQLRVTEGSLTIVGVAPAALRLGTLEPDTLTPLPLDPANPGAVGSRSFDCYGRLSPGVTLEAAQVEMTAIAAVLARQYPLDDGYGVAVSGLQDHLVREGRPALRLLMTVVAVVLLIACANLASLLMARGVRRRGELAVRASLGASRGRLMRQLTIESLVLALSGGVVGLALAYWATQALVVLTAGALTAGSPATVALDRWCLLFTFALSTVTALVFGLLPARQAGGTEPQIALRAHTRSGTADRSQHRIRRLLVVSEVALAFVLLVGASLLLRTFSSLVHVDLGFQPAGTLTMNLFLGDRPAAVRADVLGRMLDRVNAVPGVESAGTIQFLPLAGMNCGTGFWLEGEAAGDPSRSHPTDCSLVSRGYFSAMRIPLVAGRVFDGRDRMESPRVLVVNDAFARRYFPGASALGRRILVVSSNQALAEIVGVVGDVRHNGLTSVPAPAVYLLHAQTPGYITNLVVRTKGPAAAQAPAVIRAIHEIDPMQAVSGMKTMDQYLGDALSRPRLYAVLVTSFAAIALLLATIGVYGLLAYTVAQRAHEIGVRLALGAARRRVFLDLLRQGAALVIVGLAAGLLAAFALRGFVSAFLFGIGPGDPASYAAGAGAFAAAAIVAVALPAYRGSRIDPTSALREI